MRLGLLESGLQGQPPRTLPVPGDVGWGKGNPAGPSLFRGAWGGDTGQQVFRDGW